MSTLGLIVHHLRERKALIEQEIELLNIAIQVLDKATPVPPQEDSSDA